MELMRRMFAGLNRVVENTPRLRWGLLLLVCAVFVLTLLPGRMVAPRNYQPGDIAERDIKAPQDFLVEDAEATAAARRQASEGILAVYDHRGGLLREITARVQQAFALMRAVYEDNAALQRDNPAALHEKAQALKGEFEAVIGLTVSSGAFLLLEKDGFSRELADLICRIVGEILENGVVDNKELLLRETDRGIVMREIGSGTEEVVQSLKRFHSLEQARAMVRVVGQPLLKELGYNARNLVVDFAQSLIQPNISANRAETAMRKSRAAAEIKPVLLRIKAGEMLLREGERVTSAQLLKLQALRSQSWVGKVWARSVGAGLLLLCLLVISYQTHIRRQLRSEAGRNRNLLFLATLLIASFLLAAIGDLVAESIALRASLLLPADATRFGVPLAAAAMTAALLLGLDIALGVALVVALTSAVIFHHRLDIFLFFLISGIMGAYWMQHCRERKIFIRTGARLGLLNALLAALITLFGADFSGSRLPWDLLFAFLGGIGAGIVTAGIVPLVELAFGFTTDTTLMELANLEQPLLRRLMIEAPGTYHHSVIVGSLVEAAAADINANPLLAKVCGYYHDIGKAQKPLYFIENQTDGKNRHDKLAPSMSRRILVAHVKEGVEIARQHKLGQAIMDTIQQHHGTSVMTYFYEKARQLKGDEAVSPDDYRYPGPLPQTREAGLVMLADVVEAASRTLENPTPARIQGLVQRLINKVFSDGQLDHCELTLKDLHHIATRFNKILHGIHHHRIEYADSPGSGAGKEKDGGPDRQPSKKVQSLFGQRKGDGPEHLKRLGMP